MSQGHTKGGGWVLFAGSMILLVGAANIFLGLVALIDPDGIEQVSGTPLILDTSTWAIVNLILGALLALIGIGILAARPLARGVGIALVGLNALGHLASAGARPTLSVMIIAMDVVIMYSLAMYNDPTAP